MFYNEEGAEEGGLVYQGKSIPGGQDADVSLTIDQYRQDQNLYLNHTEHKDATGESISDGLQINSRPDLTKAKQESPSIDRSSSRPRQSSKKPDYRHATVRRKSGLGGCSTV